MVERNKKNTLVIVSVFLALFALWAIFGSKTGLAVMLSVTNPNTIWCADYDMACCGWTTTNEYAFGVGNPPSWIVCPFDNGVAKCKVDGVSVSPSNAQIYAGVSPCRIEWLPCGFLGMCNVVTCTNERTISNPSGITMQRGEVYYVKYLSGSINEDIYGTVKTYDVDFKTCGNSPCGVDTLGNLLGIEVPNAGSDMNYPNPMCVMNSADVVYTQYGTPQPAQVSYLTGVGSCYWYWTGQYTACGTKDSQCSLNTDCGAFDYEGYGATCVNGALTLYECRDSQICIAYDDLGGTRVCTEYDTIGSCGVYRSNWQVGNCCPLASNCPTGQYCDAETFSCVAEAECIYDWNCGTAVSCVNKVQTVPACVDGKCTDAVIANVNCCTNLDCSSGEYCDTNNQCQKQWTQCQTQCCVGVPYVYDKLCSIGEMCCPDQTCSVGGQCDLIPAQCGDSKCEAGETFANCPLDCEYVPPASTCGDGFCISPNEDCRSCPQDCGECIIIPQIGIEILIGGIVGVIILALAILQIKGVVDIVGMLKGLIP